MEVRLCRAAVTDPGCRDVVFTLDCRGHRPANGMRVLRGEVTRDRENVGTAVVIHDRELAALAHVTRVRQALAHHVDKLRAAIKIEPLVAVRREAHVSRLQGHGLCDRHGLFAG